MNNFWKIKTLIAAPFLREYDVNLLYTTLKIPFTK